MPGRAAPISSNLQPRLNLRSRHRRGRRSNDPNPTETVDTTTIGHSRGPLLPELLEYVIAQATDKLPLLATLARVDKIHNKIVTPLLYHIVHLHTPNAHAKFGATFYRRPKEHSERQRKLLNHVQHLDVTISNHLLDHEGYIAFCLVSREELKTHSAPMPNLVTMHIVKFRVRRPVHLTAEDLVTQDQSWIPFVTFDSDSFLDHLVECFHASVLEPKRPRHIKIVDRYIELSVDAVRIEQKRIANAHLFHLYYPRDLGWSVYTLERLGVRPISFEWVSLGWFGYPPMVPAYICGNPLNRQNLPEYVSVPGPAVTYDGLYRIFTPNISIPLISNPQVGVTANVNRHVVINVCWYQSAPQDARVIASKVAQNQYSQSPVTFINDFAPVERSPQQWREWVVTMPWRQRVAQSTQTELDVSLLVLS